jgi:hypothetical protein
VAPRALGPVCRVGAPGLVSTVPRASGPVLMFCAPALVFGGTEGVGYRFHVLRARNHFQLYRGRRVPFSCFVIPNSFSAVPNVSGPVFMFWVIGHVFGGAEGVGFRFHVLRSRTRFARYQGRRVPFSCFALPDSVSPVPRATSTVFLFLATELSFPFYYFCAPEPVFSGTEGFRSRFHGWRSQTRFDGTEGVSHFFMFCAPGILFGGT